MCSFSSGHRPSLQELPIFPHIPRDLHRMGPPSSVCWLINPMKTRNQPLILISQLNVIFGPHPAPFYPALFGAPTFSTSARRLRGVEDTPLRACCSSHAQVMGHPKKIWTNEGKALRILLFIYLVNIQKAIENGHRNSGFTH